MNKNFPYYLSNYLKNYLPIERNMSPNTVKSYKKTFELLIDYLINNKGYKLNQITFEKISREDIIDFLNYLEEKGNTARTRNQRLAAIKSFYKYCLTYEIENISNINRILSIKSKKYTKKIINYLTEEELQKLFNNIDTTTKIGRRDLTLLSLLYDTGGRASEIIDLKIENINLEEKRIILHGKGDKQRIVPIMEGTADLIKCFLRENGVTHEYLFQNINHNKMNDTFVRDVTNKYNYIVPNKKISPHTFRHTRAVHLLDHNVSILYIQELLGHESIITTMEYAKVIEKTKFEAIRKVTPNIISEELPDWNNTPDLLNQLLNL